MLDVRFYKPLVVGCVVLGLLIPLLLSAAPPGKPVDAGNDVVLMVAKSRHYTVHTTASVEEIKPYVNHMDAIFEEYQWRFASFKPRNPIPMNLYLFRTQDQYLKFMDKNKIDAKNSGGMFFFTMEAQGLATFLEDMPRSRILSTLQHEGFHQFAYVYIGGALPVWINEGLAQYFEDGIATGNKLTLDVVNPIRLAEVKNALKNKTALDFDKLIGMSNDDWHKNMVGDAKLAQLQYAQAWSIAFFLIKADNGKYRDAFEQMLTLMSKGTASSIAFRKSFGSDDTAPFRDRWMAYITALQPDPVATAAQRIIMLGYALATLQDKNMPMPISTQDLRNTLQKHKYAGKVTMGNVVVNFNADDEATYVYPKFDGTPVMFELIAATAAGQPPRLRASQLKPTPVLLWTKGKDGKLAPDIEYQP